MSRLILIVISLFTLHLSGALAQSPDFYEVFNPTILYNNKNFMLAQIEELVQIDEDKLSILVNDCIESYKKSLEDIDDNGLKIELEKKIKTLPKDCRKIKRKFMGNKLETETTINITNLINHKEGFVIIGAILSSSGMDKKLNCVSITNCSLSFPFKLERLDDISNRVENINFGQRSKNMELANLAINAIEQQLRKVTSSDGEKIRYEKGSPQ